MHAAYGNAWDPLIDIHPGSNLRRLAAANQWANAPARGNVSTAMGHLRRFMWETQLMLHRLIQGQY